MRQWDDHKRLNPDWIGNNPGVTRCSGRLTRTMISRGESKNKQFRCQLRWDHDGDCICYSGRKTWMKGVKTITWEQMSLDLFIEPQDSAAVLKALSLLDPDTNP